MLLALQGGLPNCKSNEGGSPWILRGAGPHVSCQAGQYVRAAMWSIKGCFLVGCAVRAETAVTEVTVPLPPLSLAQDRGPGDQRAMAGETEATMSLARAEVGFITFHRTPEGCPRQQDLNGDEFSSPGPADGWATQGTFQGSEVGPLVVGVGCRSGQPVCRRWCL